MNKRRLFGVCTDACCQWRSPCVHACGPTGCPGCGMCVLGVSPRPCCQQAHQADVPWCRSGHPWCKASYADALTPCNMMWDTPSVCGHRVTPCEYHAKCDHLIVSRLEKGTCPVQITSMYCLPPHAGVSTIIPIAARTIRMRECLFAHHPHIPPVIMHRVGRVAC